MNNDIITDDYQNDLSNNNYTIIMNDLEDKSYLKLIKLDES